MFILKGFKSCVLERQQYTRHTRLLALALIAVTGLGLYASVDFVPRITKLKNLFLGIVPSAEFGHIGLIENVGVGYRPLEVHDYCPFLEFSHRSFVRGDMVHTGASRRGANDHLAFAFNRIGHLLVVAPEMGINVDIGRWSSSVVKNFNIYFYPMSGIDRFFVNYLVRPKVCSLAYIEGLVCRVCGTGGGIGGSLAFPENTQGSDQIYSRNEQSQSGNEKIRSLKFSIGCLVGVIFFAFGLVLLNRTLSLEYLHSAMNLDVATYRALLAWLMMVIGGSVIAFHVIQLL
jgi:hypothetical protein